MPYMAPEILNGNPHTLESDIYSLGIIINEIITVIPPFNNQPHDGKLAAEICCGKRPNIREETPDSLKELIEKCWDAIPEERPTAKEILHTLSDRLYAYKSIPLKRLSYNFNESIKIRLDELNETHPQSFYTSRFFSFHNLPQPKNCSNRQKFISSRKIMKTQTVQVDTLHSDEYLECELMDID
ncbi:kinase-like domain-containing protein [Glomus cerebriforme]|uniref:Kinase-like domain-containing protein n=1 Tax=Glomus cerebriforme TaxID=658196 RepID=A0A397SYW9_9GLOM|nr:kinase-like domain-containing protein [Glomus cerebriforme]